MADIAIPICPEQVEGLSLEPASAHAQRVEAGLRGGELIIPMQPGNTPVPQAELRWTGSLINGRTVKRRERHVDPAAPRELVIKMQPAGLYGPCLQSGNLVIERDVDESAFGDVTMRQRLAISGEHPGHCGWRRTYVGATPDGVEPVREIGLEARPQGGGELGSVDALDWPPTTWTVDTLRMVPGEMAQLIWELGDGKRLSQYPADAAWWRTCILSGGYVTAIHGAYGDPAITYTVRIQGQDVTCRPTDFTGYAVGEWVTVLDATGGCTRTTRCGAETGEGSAPSAGIIVPVRVLDRTIAAALGEYALDFQSGDLGRIMDLCAEIGEVYSVQPDEDTCMVHVDGADLAAAAIHYRCTPDGSVVGGSAIFAEGDEVLILREPWRNVRVVVGFAEELRLCDVLRDTVICFLVQKFTCLDSDMAIQVGLDDGNYGWVPGSWSTHLARGKHIAEDPALEYYDDAAYCTPAYSATYERVYVRVFSDGSVAAVADPVAAGYETADAWQATLWRRILASSDNAQCPSLPEYTNRLAIGHELVAPTHQENARLPDGSRLAMAKTMAGYAAALVPAPTEDNPTPAVRTAYAIAEPHALNQWCEQIDPGGTVETRTYCKLATPGWHRDITGIPRISRFADPESCPSQWLYTDHPGLADSFEPGDHVALYLCPQNPWYEFGGGESYPGWKTFGGSCALLYAGISNSEECTCHNVTMGSRDLDCFDCVTLTEEVPPTYALQSERTPTELRDIILDESDVSLPDSVDPLGITRPLPGPCGVNTAVDPETGTISVTASGGYDADFLSDFGPYADEEMPEGSIGCALTWDGDELTMAATGSAGGGGGGDASPELAPDELTVRYVDKLRHLEIELVYRKPNYDEITGLNVHPVGLLVRGRVWPVGMEDQAVSIDISGVLDAVQDAGCGNQGYDCAVLRPWLCLYRGGPNG